MEFTENAPVGMATMRECPYCRHPNHDQALSCNLCGEVLVRQNLQNSDLSGMPGASYRDGPPENPIERNTARANRFLILVFCILFPLALFVMVGLIGEYDVDWPGLRLIGRDPGPIAWKMIPCFLMLLYAFLVAKTGEAVGQSFGLNFFLSIFPFMTPFVWARIGHCSKIKPYLYLSLITLVSAGAVHYLTEKPVLVLSLVIVLIPFFIYHLFGGAIGLVAPSLGFSSTGMVSWVCLAPPGILGILVFDLLIGGGATPSTELSGVPMPASLETLLMLDIHNDYFKIAGLIYLLATLLIWIKLIFDNIKIPTV